MVLWNDTLPVRPAQTARPTILDPECQQIVNRVVLALRPKVQPLPFDPGCPDDCLCPVCQERDLDHFKAELAIEIEHGIVEQFQFERSLGCCCLCSEIRTCDACKVEVLANRDFQVDLFVEIEESITEALLSAPFFVGPVDEFEYETTRG